MPLPRVASRSLAMDHRDTHYGYGCDARSKEHAPIECVDVIFGIDEQGKRTHLLRTVLGFDVGDSYHHPDYPFRMRL